MAVQEEEFDAIIIGIGQAGNPLAGALAGEGWRVAVVERHLAGGSCVNYGCTPTKAMIASAKTARMIATAGSMGIGAGNPQVRLAEVVKRKDRIVESFRKPIEERLEKNEKTELIYGEATFDGDKKVTVRAGGGMQRTLSASKIFINTGSRPRIPEIAGLDNVGWLDSTSILDLKEVPQHLAVIGGGYVGLEFAQMFKRFGANVTVLQSGNQLLTREDEDIAAEIKKILEDEGIKVYLQAQMKEINKKADGFELTGLIEDREKAIEGSHLLLGAGRVPNTEALDLQRAGVETDERGYVKVNEYLETSREGIFALGDVKGGPAFTHISYDDFRIVQQYIFGKPTRTTLDRTVPYVVFTDPQLGRVGLNEKQAKQKGVNYKIATMPMAKAARAIETGETRGLMKVLVNAETDRILGASILGAEGGEIMSLLQTAMMGDLPYTAIRDGVFAHPTYAESLNNLFMDVKEV